MKDHLTKSFSREAMPQNIPHLFQQRVEQWGGRIAMRHKELGIWKGITWSEYGATARQVAFALIEMGMEAGDTVTIMSENRPEWLFTDMGILSAGGICAGIYPTDSSEQVRYVLSDCQANFHFVENDEQLDKVLEIRDQLSDLKKIVVYDMKGLGSLADPHVISFKEFLGMGEKKADDLEMSLKQRLDMIEPNDPAILIYTSGTTGPPKGAMLSHYNIMKTNEIQDKANPCFPEDKVLSFLPLCHVAERNVSVMNPLRVGYCVYFAEGLDTVPENIREVAPTIFFAVPRIWEKFYSSLIMAVKDGTGLEKKTFDWAIQKGRQFYEMKNSGLRIPYFLRLSYLLAEYMVLRTLKKSIGLYNARQLTSGAAPISKDLLNFYNTLGLPIREVYGQTECCGPATMHQGNDIKVGTVGLPLPEVEVRLGEANEVLVRGPNVFLGYFRNEEKTKETLDESGWLHTGDVGYFDDDGHLVITDRMKDIIITAGGKNITPSEIENQLKFSPYINDAIVIGEARKYLTALIMIDEENVMRYAQENKIPFSTYASLANNEHIISLIDEEVQRVNERFARVEQIKTFRLIDIKLTADDEEMTPTLKLKRKFVNSKFSKLIESMY